MGLNPKYKMGLDNKVFEYLPPVRYASAAGSHTITDPSGEDPGLMMMVNAATPQRYDHNHHMDQMMPPSGVTGTSGAGNCGTYHPLGPAGTAIGGTVTTINTNLTINMKLSYKVRFTDGPNAGEQRTITNNTIGVNSILTLDTPLATAVTTADKFVILSGKFYYLNAGAKGFGVLDRALNVWTQLSIVGLPATWAVEGQLVATCMTDHEGFFIGKATGGTTTTLINTGKAWAVNQFANFQVRFTKGPNAGKVAIVASNTATVITFKAALPVAVTADSEYVIDGDQDKLYLFGNGDRIVYVYSISANTWATLTTTTTRGGVMGAGGTADWIFDVPDAEWSDEGNNQNGKFIYSFRGGATALLDRLDLTTLRWEALVYVPQVDTFTTGSGSDHDSRYIYINKENTGLIFRYNIVTNRMIGWGRILYAQGTAVAGNKLWVRIFKDPDTGQKIKWVYVWLHSLAIVARCLIFD